MKTYSLIGLNRRIARVISRIAIRSWTTFCRWGRAVPYFDLICITGTHGNIGKTKTHAQDGIFHLRCCCITWLEYGDGETWKASRSGQEEFWWGVTYGATILPDFNWGWLEWIIPYFNENWDAEAATWYQSIQEGAEVKANISIILQLCYTI